MRVWAFFMGRDEVLGFLGKGIKEVLRLVPEGIEGDRVDGVAELFCL